MGVFQTGLLRSDQQALNGGGGGSKEDLRRVGEGLGKGLESVEKRMASMLHKKTGENPHQRGNGEGTVLRTSQSALLSTFLTTPNKTSHPKISETQKLLRISRNISELLGSLPLCP